MRIKPVGHGVCLMAMNKVKLISRKASSEARQRAHRLVEDVRKHKKIKQNYKFVSRPIGSQTRRCIVQDINGKYDLDFQIILTKNSKVSESEPTRIKSDFFEAFRDCARENEKVENSTTVVTIRCSKEDGKFKAGSERFSFDFVIINSDGDKRIKRNAPNEYTWTELPARHNEIYKKFKEMTHQEQRDMFENDLLPRIIEEKKKDESVRIPSVELFYQAVNRH